MPTRNKANRSRNLRGRGPGWYGSKKGYTLPTVPKTPKKPPYEDTPYDRALVALELAEDLDDARI